MTTVEVLSAVASFLGGGFVVAVGNWLHANRVARRAREADYLRSQLRDLYGPLAFLASANESLFALVRQIEEASNSHFDRKWSDDDLTQAALTTEIDATIELSNEYVRQVVKNNERFVQVLEAAWYLVDSEDRKLLVEFQHHYSRFLTEIAQGRRKHVPFVVSQQLGSLSYMKPELIGALRSKLQDLQSRLRKIS